MDAPRYMYASPSMDKDVNLVRHVLTINLNLIQTRVGWRIGGLNRYLALALQPNVTALRYFINKKSIAKLIYKNIIK